MTVRELTKQAPVVYHHGPADQGELAKGLPCPECLFQEVFVNWVYLGIAIVSEVIGTSALKSSESFTRLYPSLVVLAGYSLSFYALSLTLATIPVGVAYAVWSGVGIILVSLVGLVVYGQKLDLAALFGIALIAAGVVVLNFFSKSAVH